MVVGYMLALKSCQWNPGCWDRGLIPGPILHASLRTMCREKGGEGPHVDPRKRPAYLGWSAEKGEVTRGTYQ